jgi:hypothetical protein
MNVKQRFILLFLRHFRDPSSWAALVTSILTAVGVSNVQTSPLVGYICGILGFVVAILLWWMDGRTNPNTDPGTGSISMRGDPAVDPKTGRTADVATAADGADVHLQTGARSVDEPRLDDGTAYHPPVRPGME